MSLRNHVQVEQEKVLIIQVRSLLLFPGQESFSDGYKQDTKLGFIVKAIYTLAHSLHNMQRHLCGRASAGVCKEMTPFNGKLYKVNNISSFNIG